MHTQSFSLELGGKTIVAEINDWALHTNGSVTIRCGETVVLVTAVMSAKPNNALPYLPLSVEYEEKFYAAGVIMGSRFMRREGKPSDEAILAARVIDRTIRPLFDHSIRHDIQIVVTILAIGEDDPDVLSIIGTSLALGISDIPWDGPVGAVRIAQNKTTGELMINPTYAKRGVGELAFEILACGKDGTLSMIEAAAAEMSESEVMMVLEAASVLHSRIEVFQKEIISAIGKQKQLLSAKEIEPALRDVFTREYVTTLRATLFSNQTGKKHLSDLKDTWLARASLEKFSSTDAERYFEEIVSIELHLGALKRGERADGRGFDDIRPLYAGVGGISPVLHGSGVFYRGETHMVSVLTLGGPEAAQSIDTVEDQQGSKQFMHHYNFPPFSVGETGRVGGFNRRMIGHGALAEKALTPVIPSEDTFPYTIRLVSETMSSNGSSSMGAVCASTLALMDGGVPITRPVAGIASGVLIDGDQFVILTDIQGPEDEYGDMDFKVAGTRVGITAIQMDVKVDGVSHLILTAALKKAHDARLKILEVMSEAIAVPRSYLSNRAPHITKLSITPDQIGLVIGSGGKTINKIKADSAVKEISIKDSGEIFITGTAESTAHAARIINELTKRYEIGDTTSATISRLTPFGAFASLDTFHEGLIHISEIAPHRIESLEGILEVGDVVPVTIIKIDQNKIGLSIKKHHPTFIQPNK